MVTPPYCLQGLNESTLSNELKTDVIKFSETKVMSPYYAVSIFIKNL